MKPAIIALLSWEGHLSAGWQALCTGPMGQKKEPKKSDEEKAAEKVAKLNASLIKACKNDERSKVEEYVSKGASVNFINEKGENSVAHVAAAFGALDVIRFLFKNGADFHRINQVREIVVRWIILSLTETLPPCCTEEADAARSCQVHRRGECGQAHRGTSRGRVGRGHRR